MIFRRKDRINSEKWRRQDFYLWLECYLFTTKEEFEELEMYKQENIRDEFKMFRRGLSQFNIYEDEE